MQSLCLPNTVKLTLSIQHASEVELLLQHNSLPSIKHLEVTNEDLHIVLPITLDYLGKFQELCSSKRLPALKNLHFSFCFPQQIEVAWRMSLFN
ncbi:unnamed protein product [Rotaria sordida]|nr:unnamed protein product [Rotaria sordida]